MKKKGKEETSFRVGGGYEQVKASHRARMRLRLAGCRISGGAKKFSTQDKYCNAIL